MISNIILGQIGGMFKNKERKKKNLSYRPKSSEIGEYLFAPALYGILLYRVVGYFKEKKVS